MSLQAHTHMLHQHHELHKTLIFKTDAGRAHYLQQERRFVNNKCILLLSQYEALRFSQFDFWKLAWKSTALPKVLEQGRYTDHPQSHLYTKSKLINTVITVFDVLLIAVMGNDFSNIYKSSKVSFEFSGATLYFFLHPLISLALTVAMAMRLKGHWTLIF